MARQSGLIKIKETLDNVSFYKSKDRDLARMKTSLDGKRIATDPAFIRTRENGAEFGSSASSGKILRDLIRTMMQNASDGKVSTHWPFTVIRQTTGDLPFFDLPRLITKRIE